MEENQAENELLSSLIATEGTIVAGPDANLISSNAHAYIEAATSSNTRKAYRSDIRHFIAWGGVLPATTEAIIAYLHHYAKTLNPRTLSRRLTALKNWHCYQSFLDPTAHPLVTKTLIGIKNIHGRPKKKALALQIEQLVLMVERLNKSDRLIDIRNNALLQIGLFGAFRRSELVAIRFEHLNFVKEGLEILIPRSKTDQTGEGRICVIPYGEESLCPPTALKNWCEKADIQSGMLFRRITKSGRISQEGIAANHLNIIIKAVAERCGLPNSKQYSGHSLRGGFAVAAGKEEISLNLIMQQGRWKHANTALGYMEEGQRFDRNAAGMILQKRINHSN